MSRVRLCFTTLLYIGCFILFSIQASGQSASSGHIRWHNEGSDTLKIVRLLEDAVSGTTDMNGKVVKIAHSLIGTPYMGGTLEGEPEMLTIDFEGMDCTTFVETVAALALTASEGRTAWQDFAYNLEQLRYRQGHINGYGSRLHYVSDWIVDNTHRGNLMEVTDRMPGSAYQVKTLDYMSRHRGDYPAMADDATYEKIKDCEVGYRSHRFPYIRSSALMNKKTLSMLRAGDIVAFTTKLPGLDVSHLGIITVIDGQVHVIHASSRQGKVVEDSLTIGEYLKKNPAITGARIIRLK